MSSKAACADPAAASASPHSWSKPQPATTSGPSVTTATSPTSLRCRTRSTERVVAAIEPELYAAENVRSQSKPPDSLDAWECVIRALSLIGQGTHNENTAAEALCRRAI